MQSGSTPQTPDYFKNINAPDIPSEEIQLQQLVQQGVISPEDATTVTQGSSDLNNISTDPALKQNQMDALLGLQNISDSGGMTDSDKANLAGIANNEATQSRGARDAILQNAQARGMGGSGLELMSQLQNQQDSATRQSQKDMTVAGQAQDRALQALIQQGNMSGSMQNQAFNQQAQVANANDAISRFNAQNQQQQINTNAAAQNQAQAANTAMKQSVADSNVGLNNQQEQYNKNVIQQNFNNQLAKAGASGGVASQNAQAAGANSQAAANANNQTIGTAASIVGTMYGGPAGGAAANAAVNSTKKNNSSSGMKTGGIVEGGQPGFDSTPKLLEPGEVVISKDEVPDILAKAHTDKNGKFDAAGFLDTITGHKYGYSKKGRK